MSWEICPAGIHVKTKTPYPLLSFLAGHCNLKTTAKLLVRYLLWPSLYHRSQVRFSGISRALPNKQEQIFSSVQCILCFPDSESSHRGMMSKTTLPLSKVNSGAQVSGSPGTVRFMVPNENDQVLMLHFPS